MRYKFVLHGSEEGYSVWTAWLAKLLLAERQAN